MKMLFSIVICTHNRANLLDRALSTACNQQFPDTEYEVIVVDNASTDRTQETVSNYANQKTFVQYVYEEQIGLSIARNRGWREANGKYISYLDDDVLLPNTYLENVAEIICEIAPDFCGGPFKPYYEVVPPNWFKDSYGSMNMGEIPRTLKTGEYLVGGNLVIRREILVTSGGFSAEFGMRGKIPAYGEETAFQKLIRDSYPDTIIYYSPMIEVLHTVRNDQLFWPIMIKKRFAMGRYNFLALKNSHENFSFRHILQFFILPVLILYQITFGVLMRNRKRYPFPQNYFFEQVLEMIAKFGRSYERLRLFLGFER
jgi:glycosyltransferase involved in cell wall biosynthesis